MKKCVFVLCFCILATSFLLVACTPEPYKNWESDVQKLVDAGFELYDYVDKDYLRRENDIINKSLAYAYYDFSVKLVRKTQLAKEEDNRWRMVVIAQFATKKQADNMFRMYTDVERDVDGDCTEQRFFQIGKTVIMATSKAEADILGYDFVRYGDLKTGSDYSAWLEDSNKLFEAGIFEIHNPPTTSECENRLNEWLKENKQPFETKLRRCNLRAKEESDTFDCVRIEFLNRVQAEQFHNFYVGSIETKPDNNSKSCRIGRVVIIVTSQEAMEVLGYEFV